MSEQCCGAAGNGCACDARAARDAVVNAPGRSALAYRVGTHASFLRGMLARVGTATIADGERAGARPLRALRTRATEDPAVAVMDAWAAVGDVLSFYQERVANEGFLRTATEARSVRELARLVGYQPRPGVAASTWLAFTVDDAPGAPGRATVPKGTQVQSVPAAGKSAQTFETDETLEARAEWNAMRPRQTRPQRLAVRAIAGVATLAWLTETGATFGAASAIEFAGTRTGLVPGDLLLVVPANGDSATDNLVLEISAVTVDTARETTRVLLVGSGAAEPPPFEPAPCVVHAPVASAPAAAMADYIASDVIGDATGGGVCYAWREEDLAHLLALTGWDPAAFAAEVERQREPTPRVEVFAFRKKVGFWGNASKEETPNTTSVWASLGVAPRTPPAPNVILDRIAPEVIPGSWVVVASLQGPESTRVRRAYQVSRTTDSGVFEHDLFGRATGLYFDGLSIPSQPEFRVRYATAYVQSERLALASWRYEQPLGASAVSSAADDALALDGLVLGLAKEARLALVCPAAAASAALAAEVLVVDHVVHRRGWTVLHVRAPLERSYARSTAVVVGNLARATHGETVTETLGSGDPSRANQTFVLRRAPLAYVPNAAPAGAASTLEVRIDGVSRQEAATLYELDSRADAFTTRLDDDGHAIVVFGDGTHGARVAGGTENVTARYRVGGGLDGLVDARTLTTLPARPLGIRAVSNPTATAGAAARESRDAARAGTPRVTRTLDRVVSRADAEAFARSFAGVGKAQAMELVVSGERVIHVTVAGADGAALPPTGATIEALRRGLDRARDRATRLVVSGDRRRWFRVGATIGVEAGHEPAAVLGAARAALAAAFGFEARAFGQSVSATEVVARMQATDGVAHVRLTALQVVGVSGAAMSAVLRAGSAFADGTGFVGAELLLLSADDSDLRVEPSDGADIEAAPS